MSDDTKVCPFCAETIKSAAIVCRFCNRDLIGPVQRQAPVLQSALRNCPDCGGRGQARIDCWHCNGYGKEDCERCGGDGEIWVRDGTALGNVARCNVCHGSRQIRCDYCNGSGNEQTTCSTCSGSGQMTFEDFESLKHKRQKEEQRRAEEAEQRAEEANRLAAIQAEEQAKSARLREQQQAEQRIEATRKVREEKQREEKQREEKQREAEEAAQQAEAEKRWRVEKAICVECGLPLGMLDRICLRLRHKDCP